MKNKKIKEFLTEQLFRIEKPGRYIGGEFGTITPEDTPDLRVCICFPDLYEIGMSNLSLKIFYNIANTIPSVQCERVFAPARDFEELLRDNSIPLYSLETYTPLHQFDVVAVTVSYELGATNILNILDCGGIPYRRQERGEHHPVVIAGGPGITNPAPLSPFFDSVLIGEGEEEIKEILTRFRDIKSENGSRQDLLNVFNDKKSWWYPEKQATTAASVYSVFGKEPFRFTFYPVPHLKTAQDHGVVEIMRGCPNGCRFCHAGYFYRPQREKEYEAVRSEVLDLVNRYGYREISLSSLSSGDHSCLWEFLALLNSEFNSQGVSFSLPSLKVETFTFDNISALSSVRKSGLTFAVETPLEEAQAMLNKRVTGDYVISILRSAKEAGWRQAKFYFMIGLPVSLTPEKEADAIIEFISEIKRAVKINLSINLGTFVPKPHTPFQWDRQLSIEESFTAIHRIKHSLRSKNVKISFHSPFLSYLEGIIARGDDTVAGLIESSFLAGARFDAWDDLNDRKLWEKTLEDFGTEHADSFLDARSDSKPLAWDSISLGTSKQFLVKEKNKSGEGRYTRGCTDECDEPCGNCRQTTKISKASRPENGVPETDRTKEERETVRILFSFTKTDMSVFLSHLNIMTLFERALLRAGFSLQYTRGFNPKPKLEFAQPLPLGYQSTSEIAAITLENDNISRDDFPLRLSAALIPGIRVIGALCYGESYAREGRKPPSLMSLYWGSSFELTTSPEAVEYHTDALSRYSSLNSDVVTGIESDTESGSIKFSVRAEQGKGNIKKIAGFLEENSLSCSVSSRFYLLRSETWASDKNSNPVSYFDFFTEK